MEPTLPDPLPRTCRRVVLRRLALADLPAFQAYRQDETVGRYQDWEPQSERVALQFITDMNRLPLFPRGRWAQLGIADRRTNALIGDVGVCVSANGEEAAIGVTLAPAAEGVGLGTEAVREAMGLVFERAPIARIVAVTDARNLPSARLLERVGMRRVDTVARAFRGEPCTEHIYAISRPESDAVSLQRATPDMAPLLGNLLELYIHDVSAVFSVALGPDGRFGYDKLPLYWAEPAAHRAYLIKRGTRIAGFALATRGSPASDDPEDLDVAEFFVLRAYRRAGVGRDAAFRLWDSAPGHWVVRVAEANRVALPFWGDVVRAYTSDAFTESTQPGEPQGWRVFRFASMAQRTDT